MKTYFAKWIVVNTELKQGDKFVRTSSQWVIHDNYTPSFQNLDMTELKKVELSLCSRNLKKGDRIICTDGIEREVDHFECIILHGGWEFTDGHYESVADVYKALGPISRDANWVKDGDEFDDSEIQKNMVCPDCFDNDYTGNCTCFYQRYTPIFRDYSIKGHCGHFH